MTKYVYPGKLFKLETSRYLQSVPNRITSLELDGIRYGDALLDYMYSVPHLLELKAPYFRIVVNFLARHVGFRTEDIGQQQQAAATNSSTANTSISNSTTSPNSHVRRVWACKKLRLLHIGFRSSGEIKTSDPAVSRFVFGYLARVCPHLQDLEARGFMVHNNDQPEYYVPVCLKLEQLNLHWDQIGLLKDVEAVVQEKDTKNCSCWRKLRSLSIYDMNPLGLPVEKEIRRVFSGLGSYNTVQLIIDAFR